MAAAVAVTLDVDFDVALGVAFATAVASADGARSSILFNSWLWQRRCIVALCKRNALRLAGDLYVTVAC